MAKNVYTVVVLLVVSSAQAWALCCCTAVDLLDPSRKRTRPRHVAALLSTARRSFFGALFGLVLSVFDALRHAGVVGGGWNPSDDDLALDGPPMSSWAAFRFIFMRLWNAGLVLVVVLLSLRRVWNVSGASFGLPSLRKPSLDVTCAEADEEVGRESSMSINNDPRPSALSDFYDTGEFEWCLAPEETILTSKNAALIIEKNGPKALFASLVPKPLMAAREPLLLPSSINIVAVVASPAEESTRLQAHPLLRNDFVEDACEDPACAPTTTRAPPLPCRSVSTDSKNGERQGTLPAPEAAHGQAVAPLSAHGDDSHPRSGRRDSTRVSTSSDRQKILKKHRRPFKLKCQSSKPIKIPMMFQSSPI